MSYDISIYIYFVTYLEYMPKQVTFIVEVKRQNRIVIPKNKADELEIVPGDYIKIIAEKIIVDKPEN